MLNCFFLLDQFTLLLVVVIDVTVLALAFSVISAILVFTIGDHALATVSVVAVVTHPFGKVLQSFMGALRYHAWFSTTSQAKSIDAPRNNIIVIFYL